MIQKYLDAVDVTGKSFVLCAITPKEKFPQKSYSEDFHMFAKQILTDDDNYISLFEAGRKEILQDVAFKIYTLPLIGDSYDFQHRRIVKQKRATKEQIEAFIVLKEYYNTVPHGELSEEEAVRNGLEKADSFIKKYPSNKHDIVIKNVKRHEDGVSILREMTFNNDNDEYYFGFCYCY
jgi:hypothetical protein